MKTRLALCVMALAVLSGAPAMGGEGTDAEEDQFTAFNYAFAAQLGSGLYTSNGRNVFVVHIPLAWKVRDEEERGWGIQVTVPVTLGFYDVEPEDLAELEWPDTQLGTVSVVPGVEFRVPVNEQWMLMPFIEFGPAKELGQSGVSGVFGSGLRSRADFPWKSSIFVLWNRLLFAANTGPNTSEVDDFALFETDFEYRHPVNFRMYGADAAFGFYGKYELYFNNVLVQRKDDDPLQIEGVWEVGIVVGPMRPPDGWKGKLPRFGVGYRQGYRGSSVRLALRLRY